MITLWSNDNNLPSKSLKYLSKTLCVFFNIGIIEFSKLLSLSLIYFVLFYYCKILDVRFAISWFVRLVILVLIFVDNVDILFCRLFLSVIPRFLDLYHYDIKVEILSFRLLS